MPSRRTIRRRFGAEALAVLSSGATVAAAAWLPWHRSGSVRRSGFALARVADRVGVVTGGPRRLLFVCAALLPLAAASVLAAVVVGRTRVAGVFSCIVGVIGLASVLVVLVSTDSAELGPPIAAGAAVLAAACGVRLLLRRSARVRNH
jgi:hypothetical protein